MGRIEIFRERCKGCGLCLTVCPKKGLRLATLLNERGVNPPERIEDIECTGCAFCALICPDCAIRVFRDKKKSSA